MHLANTDFEFELANPQPISIEESWKLHPTCLQLQFLPLLYALPNEKVAVTSFPDPLYLDSLQRFLGNTLPSLYQVSRARSFYHSKCLSWGPSLRVQAWAKECEMEYAIPPDWSVVQEVNSKSYSLQCSPLKESRLIDNLIDLNAWMSSLAGPKVLKTCFGLSGLGHLLVNEHTLPEKIQTFCHKEWSAGRPVIAEPWLDRVFDFSTQWAIGEAGDIQFLGSTVFETNAKGVYQGTLSGTQQSIFKEFFPFLEDHVYQANNMLRKVQKLGFFGHVGIDAFLYECSRTRKICLYPIVEINGRKTLSYVALCLQQRYFPDQAIRLTFKPYSTEAVSLLPTYLLDEMGKAFHFKRRLVMERLSCG